PTPIRSPPPDPSPPLPQQLPVRLRPLRSREPAPQTHHRDRLVERGDPGAQRLQLDQSAAEDVLAVGAHRRAPSSSADSIATNSSSEAWSMADGPGATEPSPPAAGSSLSK